MSLKEMEFESANGKDIVKAWLYTPIVKPRLVVQIMHGLGEHSRRYLHMIGTFLDAGFVVCAQDCIGHGKTGKDSGTLGNPRANDFMDFVKDQKCLHDIASDMFPKLPYFMYGYSWGTMILRAYASLHPNDMRGMVLSGVVVAREKIRKIFAGEEFVKDYLENPEKPAKAWWNKMFQHTTVRYENAEGNYDWLARDKGLFRDIVTDEFNTFHFTVKVLWDIKMLHEHIEENKWAKELPADFPILLMSGDQDPFCDYGEGLYHLANALFEAGKKVEVKIYHGYRHEIHNEPDIREDVEKHLVEFINRVNAGNACD